MNYKHNVFQEARECNLSIVREFYANYPSGTQPQFVTVCDVQVPVTPLAINQVLGTEDNDSTILTTLHIQPPYRDIKHTLSRPHSTARWTRHRNRGYHQSFPYAHMTREARIWLKIVMHCFIPGLHFTECTRDRVCLVYALMMGREVNRGAILKSSMRKARVHKGRRYAFGGFITRLCLDAGVPTEALDYVPRLIADPYVVMNTREPDLQLGPILTTAERYRCDEMITATMYGLQMLSLQTGSRSATQAELDEVERRYSLNEHARALLGFSPQYFEPLDDVVPTDVEHQRVGSDVESEEEVAKGEPLTITGGEDGEE